MAHKNLVGVVYHSEIESMKAAIELKKVVSVQGCVQECVC